MVEIFIFRFLEDFENENFLFENFSKICQRTSPFRSQKRGKSYAYLLNHNRQYWLAYVEKTDQNNESGVYENLE